MSTKQLNTSPPVAAPVITSAGTIDRAKVGLVSNVSGFAYTGTGTVTYSWRAQGVGVGQNATRTPSEANHGKSLVRRTTVTNTAGSAFADTPALTVTYQAPVAAGAPADQIYTQGSGTQAVATAKSFTVPADADKSGVTYSLVSPPAGVTINSATGVVSISTAAPFSAPVVVRATNSGGSAASRFSVTVAALRAPATLGAEEWTATGLASDGRQIAVYILSAPNSGGAPITDYECRIDGGTAFSLGSTTLPVAALISDLVNETKVSVSVRAVNAVGAGSWSTPVLVTPEDTSYTASVTLPRTMVNRTMGGSTTYPLTDLVIEASNIYGVKRSGTGGFPSAYIPLTGLPQNTRFTVALTGITKTALDSGDAVSIGAGPAFGVNFWDDWPGVTYLVNTTGGLVSTTASGTFSTGAGQTTAAIGFRISNAESGDQIKATVAVTYTVAGAPLVIAPPAPLVTAPPAPEVSRSILIASSGTSSGDLGAPVTAVRTPTASASAYDAFVHRTRAGLDASDIATVGQVVTVDNLNDSGAGSLRAAVFTAGTHPIVIYPTIAGVIQVASEIRPTRPNVFLDATGLVLKRAAGNARTEALWRHNADNWIIQNLTILPGVPNTTAQSNVDRAFAIAANRQNIVLRHCSFGHTNDQLFSTGNANGQTINNIVLEHCIFAEAIANAPNAHEANHNYGPSFFRGAEVHLRGGLGSGSRMRTPIIEQTGRVLIDGHVIVGWHPIYTDTRATATQRLDTNNNDLYADQTTYLSLLGVHMYPDSQTKQRISDVEPYIMSNNGANYETPRRVYCGDNFFPSAPPARAPGLGAGNRARKNTSGGQITAVNAPPVWSATPAISYAAASDFAVERAGAHPRWRGSWSARVVAETAAIMASAWADVNDSVHVDFASSRAPGARATVPADANPTGVTLPSPRSAPFTVEANGRPRIENDLRAHLASLGGTWGEGVGEPIGVWSPSLNRFVCEVTIQRNGTWTARPLDDHIVLSGVSDAAFEVVFEDGTTAVIPVNAD